MKNYNIITKIKVRLIIIIAIIQHSKRIKLIFPYYIDFHKKNKMDKELLKRIYSNIIDNTAHSIMTGYSELDSILSTCSRGSLITVGGVNSSGKSSLLRNVLINQTLNNNKCVYFSLESSRENFTKLLICTYINIPLYKAFMNSALTKEAKLKLNTAINEMQDWDLEIYDCSLYKLEKIIQEIISIRPDYVFIDGIDEIRINEKFDTKEILKSLKNITDKIKATIFITTKINLGTINNEFNIPTNKDFNDSENILKYSEEVLILYRPDIYYMQDDMPEGFKSKTINIIATKNSKAIITLDFDNRYGKIKEIINK